MNVNNQSVTTVYRPLDALLHSRFAHDTVLTVAAAWAILEKTDYAVSFKTFGRKYPNAGYGGAFLRWSFEHPSAPYNSCGNGSAMRLSPVGCAFSTIDEVLLEAKKSAEVTHNHPESIKGAQATAPAVFLAQTGASKGRIREEISLRLGYDLDHNRRFDLTPFADEYPHRQAEVINGASLPHLCFHPGPGLRAGRVLAHERPLASFPAALPPLVWGTGFSACIPTRNLPFGLPLLFF